MRENPIEVQLCPNISNDMTKGEELTTCEPNELCRIECETKDKDNQESSRYRKWALLDKSRRLKASARERKRRHVLNNALELLRKKVPCVDQNPQKLSKIEVLRLAIDYIAMLSCYLNSSPGPSVEQPGLASLGAQAANMFFSEQAASFNNNTTSSFFPVIPKIEPGIDVSGLDECTKKVREKTLFITKIFTTRHLYKNMPLFLFS